MCGIVGIVSHRGGQPDRSETLRRMTACLEHRGPDDAGYYADGYCALGFRRLAIRDLAAPSPPFSNETDDIWTVANAEIYNSDPLRRALEKGGHAFRTGVDTETIPHLYEERGSAFVEDLDGMFALAVWDSRERTLLLARDPAGEKPLFYWEGPEDLVFASELSAILAYPGVPRELDAVALRRYLLHDFFPAPLTPFHGIRKLPAGHLLVLKDGRAEVRCYWDLAPYFGAGRPLSMRAAAGELDRRIAIAVEGRSRSDVPLGVFLSGGLDSATLLAHLTEQQGRGVPVFSLGHADASFDEAHLARETARHFGADFHELKLTEADLAEGLERVTAGFDEPLGDASIIPTHLLALFARQRVKVVLSGEGADELFAGYPTYPGHRVADCYQRLPGWARSGLVRGASRLLPVSMGNVSPDYLLRRFTSAATRDPVERHHIWFGSLEPRLLRQVLSERLGQMLNDDGPFASARSRLEGRHLPDDLSRWLYTDFTMYLQDDLLTKVDRATMLASLEARAPFLDRQLAQFVAALPSRLKLSGLRTKAVLRRAARDRLPRAVLQRRKRGFNIPFSRWLMHGLGEQLRERFSHERVSARGLFRAAGIHGLIDEHLSRRADHRKPLFTLLMLDHWCDRFFSDGPVPIGGAK
jgi:asparagine synthase (glutamine-hydrolysing)